MQDFTLPESLDAEINVIANMINDAESVDVALEIIKNEEEFYHKRNKLMYKAIMSLASRGKSINRVSIAEELKAMDALEMAGGPQYIAEVGSSYVTGARQKDLAEIVHEKYLFRRLAGIADEIKIQALEAKGQAVETIGEAENMILNLGLKSSDDDLKHIGGILKESSEDLANRAKLKGALSGLSTGFKDIDDMLSGFQKSDLILLAARPSMGKTALGVNFAVNAAQNKKTVAIFSLEMSKTQLALRIYSQLTNISLSNLIQGDLKVEDWKRISKTLVDFSQNNLYIDDMSGTSVQEMRAKLRRLKLEQGLDLVVIDYLQLMEAGGQNENRTLEISKISRGLKAMAKELDVPVIALSQLSRAPEQRTNHRPILSDLRESGAIEQDADVVLFLYRDEYYNPDSEDRGIGEVIIAKHRNGPTGTVKLVYKGENTKFLPLAKVDAPTDLYQ
ncbi:replicative DNA helicase [uncultured Ezakiella sp.]|uniref:replicative DNA helicase n=1 Tax=uncultured Ezakiella sp. TaxID=1637529 RepID=UPI0025EA439A|nr:replicative DNA helicase [uncultured Ezakiella sp.]